MTESLRMATESAARSIAESVDRMFDGLVSLQAAALALTRVPGDASRKSLDGLRGAVEEFILAQDGLVDGAGLAVAPGVLRDAEAWLHWWRWTGDGGLQFKDHTFNPNSMNFYDYPAQDWFHLPSTRGGATLVGPYIDNGGTGIRVITAGVALERGQKPSSVLAADLSLDYLEKLFLRTLGRWTQQVVVATSTGKVVVSNTARHVTGTLMDPRYLRGDDDSMDVVFSRAQGSHWRLLVLP